jgi:quinoprotein glucose dehydrogenase
VDSSSTTLRIAFATSRYALSLFLQSMIGLPYYGGLLLGSNNLPVSSPPWNTLTAYDLNEGTIKWQVPLGTIPFLAAKRIKDTGAAKFNLASNHNGPAVTGGGLVFIGSYGDGFIHALDKDTGKTLWEKELDANPEGIPAVYEVGGRQYIVFMATGLSPNQNPPRGANVTWKPGKAEAQGYYVFALPAAAPTPRQTTPEK